MLNRDLVRETPLIAAAIFVYFGIRNWTAGNAGEAFGNSDALLRLERGVGMAWEKGLQSQIIGSDTLVTLANWVYIWGHWPVILLAAGALFVFRRERYYLLRNALFISGAIGFLFFALLPVAPPRLLGLGLVDTVSQHSHAYRALQPPGLTNQYAAFPSLHAGSELARRHRPNGLVPSPSRPLLRGRLSARDGACGRRHGEPLCDRRPRGDGDRARRALGCPGPSLAERGYTR